MHKILWLNLGVPRLAGFRMRGKRGAFLAFIGLLLTFVSVQGAAIQEPRYRISSVRPPDPRREYRAAWVATVSNIDWPSTNRLKVPEQKAELLAILNKAADLKLNVIIFQVRPACDAMYASALEPWSEYLTGTMGVAPDPFWDPLAFAVEEAHKRGLELHAWFNPYRARHQSAKSPISANHISKKRPDLVRKYGGYLWLDPGEPEVQDYSLRVVMDVVKRYNVDGIHFDDYFYPYAVRDASGKEVDFPDEQSWTRYGKKTGLTREDWRRENVNRFIQQVNHSIKATKPWVKFGISPFGIWRPGNPAQIVGFDAYDKLYADARKWIVNGWMDYFAPQLYWAIQPPQQSFPVLLNWWAEQNQQKRHLVPGMDSTKVGRAWAPEEIINQIRITRQQNVAGHIHWNIKSLMRKNGLDAAVQREVYQQPAILPAMTWLRQKGPEKPKMSISSGNRVTQVSWRAAEGQPIAVWVLQTFDGQRWTTTVVPGKQTRNTVEGPAPAVVAVRGVDRFGNTSPTAVMEVYRR
jgi:uncharacterized lipoprotein YddW (UPF0748 family)